MSNADQTQHYSRKLEYEIDSWDLNDVRNRAGRVTVIDARSPAAFQRGHSRRR